MTRGEVWWANLPSPWGRRPVLLVARDQAYNLLTSVMVAPLTTAIREHPASVLLDPRTDGVPRTCIANLDQITPARIEWLDTRIVRLTAERMTQVDRAIHFALGLRD